MDYMESGFDKNQIIGDYTSLIAAMLPGMIGLRCLDRAKQPIFDEVAESDIEYSPAYYDAVHAILGSPEQACDLGRLELDGAIAFLLPLDGDKGKPVGVVSILFEPASTLTWPEVFEAVRPAVRSMQRELILRYRLVTAYKKLNVRAAEENLLHQVEKLVHLRRSAEETLSHILLLCRKFLQVRGAALMIPDKHIRLFEGDALSPVEARLLLTDMAEPANFDPLQAEADAELPLQDDGQVDHDSDVFALPVRHERQEPIGILALSGWENQNFSLRRKRRISRFLVGSIEDVISRDYDALTGLMSWQLFEARMVQVLEGDSEQGETEKFIAYCDIDQFHVINDNFGSETGNEILAEFAKLLRVRFGRDAVTRITGDTFAAFLPDTHLDVARELAEELCTAFAELECQRGDKSLRPSVSIGVAPIMGEPTTASAAMAPAQVACRAAKDRGRGRVETYQQDDASLIQRVDDIQLVGHIRSAIESERLLVTAQPIVPLEPGNDIHYFEVLSRLLNSSGQQILPSQYISAAERYQLMEELDRLVIKKTLGILSARMNGLQRMPLRVAINLSGQSLGSQHFLAFVEEQIAASGLPPTMLCFEITESVAVAHLQRAQQFMHALRSIGCSFSLDDFGTGLSSFAYLKLFPIDTLKIDGSFIRDMTSNVVSQSVVAAISEVAKVMNLQTVAEYVEDQEALNLLCDLGVHYGQGFLLGRPEPFDDVLDALISADEAKQISAVEEAEEVSA